MALGAVALGYGDERVLRAAITARANGNVAGLAHTAEVELAERLCDVIPCAEQVRFLKTGAEAVSAAVRITRGDTGRNTVVGCGYFGWHDWSSTSPAFPSARADFQCECRSTTSRARCRRAAPVATSPRSSSSR